MQCFNDSSIAWVGVKTCPNPYSYSFASQTITKHLNLPVTKHQTQLLAYKTTHPSGIQA